MVYPKAFERSAGAIPTRAHEVNGVVVGVPSCAVVVPAYKAEPDEQGCLALRQCLSILYRYPVWLIVPRDLSLERYRDLTGAPP